MAVQGLYRPELTTDPFNAPVAFSLPQEVETVSADSNGNVVYQKLDRAGQVISAKDGSGNLPSVKRNELNLVTERTNGRQQTTNYEYDSLTRNLLSVKYSLSGEASPQLPTTNNPELFVSGNDYFIQPGLVSLAVGDIDEDSKLDIITANPFSTNSVTIVSGNGDGTFINTLPPIAVGSSPLSVAVADFNSDQHLDIVTANKSSNNVSVLLGNGDGTFVSSNIAVGIEPVAVVVSDLNNDGLQDIVTANRMSFDTSSVSVLLGSSDGTFSPKQDYSTAIPDISSLAIKDVNKDGRLDVVAVGIGTAYSFEQDYYSVFLGEESGIFNVTTDYEVAFSSDFVALSDLDDDGNLDMVTANYTADTVSVRRGNGDGTFEAVTDDYQVENTPVSLALDDVNGDGNTDIVVGVRDGSNVAVLLGGENGSFVRSDDVSVGYAPVSVALADVDLDGDKDLVAGSYGSNVSVRLNTSNDSADTGGTGERRYTYEAGFNQVTSEIDELGRKTLYEIDPITGNRLSETRVVGNVGGVDDVVTRYSYTNGGLVDTVIDPLGRVTDYDYDLLTRNLTKVTYAVGTVDQASQQFEYDAAGNQTAMIDENGNRTEYKYDALNRLYKSTFAVGTSDEGAQLIEYDAEGNQKAVIDENGNRTDLVYDVMGRLVKTVEADPDGTGDQTAPVSVYEYDFNGNQVKVIDPLGRITQSVYDSRNRRIGVIDSDGNRTQFRYDLDNNLTSVIDPLNQRSNFVYDARGRLKNEIDPLGKITTYEYNPANNLIAQIDRNNHRTEYDYDDLGRQTKQINAKQDVFTTTYDKAGNILSEIDELNRTTNYTYDNRNRQTKITDALNGVTQIGYDAVGNRTSVSDPLNRTTTFNYDKRNRLSSVSDPLNHTTTYSYDDVGNVTALSDALQRNTQYIYDKLNRHISTKDAVLNNTSVIYDAVGNVISTTDQLGRTTSYTYDNQNRPTTVINPLGDKITTQYDANGNQIAIIDGLGNTTRYGYDPLNRPITLTDALNKTTTITYDNSGNLRTITDPEQNTTTYTYDELDRLIEEKNQLNKARYFTYDAVGNRLTAKDRNGRIRQFEYDNLNRQTIEQWLDENGNIINTINYDFDAASQLKYAEDSNSTYGYSYDTAGRLIAVDNWRSSSVPNVRLDYVYDNVNNLLSVTDTIDGIIKGTKSFTVDSLNRVTKITQSGNNVTPLRVDIGYDVASQMKSVTRYSDLLATQLVAQSDYNYDLVGRLTQLTHRKGTATFANYNWSFDAANRIVGFGSPDGNSSYSYDSGNQLTATDHNYQGDEAYSYDDNGNRLGVPYQVQTNNQLQSDGVYNYEYDAEGNRIKQIEIATLKVTEYVWDYRNRLTGVITKDSNGNVVKSVEYTYDVFNRRIAKEIDSDGNGPVVPLVEGLVYDGEHIILSFDGEGNQTHRYLHGPLMDAILADSRGDNQVNWALGDNQGTVRDVINSQGVLENHISYDSFGNVTGETNSSLGFRFGYTGRELDSETGLYYYRARYYDGLNGRFISEDPIGFDGGDGNLYRYVGNSSPNFTDPTGLITFIIPGGGNEFGALPGLIIGAEYPVYPLPNPPGLGPGNDPLGNKRAIAAVAEIEVIIAAGGGLKPGEPINIIAHSDGTRVADKVAPVIKGLNLGDSVTVTRLDPLGAGKLPFIICDTFDIGSNKLVSLDPRDPVNAIINRTRGVDFLAEEGVGHMDLLSNLDVLFEIRKRRTI